jgi:hypothetical protein
MFQEQQKVLITMYARGIKFHLMKASAGTFPSLFSSVKTFTAR